MKVLTKEKVKRFYDNWGARQDEAGCYEDKALAATLEFGQFKAAHNVFEFGFGTGRFAEDLFCNHLPEDSLYYGVDISSTMFELANKRLSQWRDRVQLKQTEGEVAFDLEDGSFDRFVSHFVCDILSDAEVEELLHSAHRLLCPGGLAIISGLHRGQNIVARLIGGFWSLVWQMNAYKVGGCRPMNLCDYYSGRDWRLVNHTVTTHRGLASETLVLERI